MSTTTIRIEDDLKARLAVVAEREGRSSHAFIVDAIARTVERAEEEQAFLRIADARMKQVLTTGKTIPLDDAIAYLEARARGERARRPTPRKLSK